VRKEIRNVTKGGKAVPAEVLTAQPGTPGTYRVLKATVGEYKGELVLDLGFSCYFRPEKGLGFREGDIVTLEKVKLEKSRAGAEALYTYQADVVEVIDGDTLKASIPLGFGFTTLQKLRLRGLDAPEIESAEGKEAKAFLESRFRKSKASILIRTTRSDKYDRYLADVYITDTEGNQVFLNNLLLESGLAVRMGE